MRNKIISVVLLFSVLMLMVACRHEHKSYNDTQTTTAENADIPAQTTTYLIQNETTEPQMGTNTPETSQNAPDSSADTTANTAEPAVTTTAQPPEEHIHTPEPIAAISPTCTAGGFTEGKKCADCGAIIVVQRYISKLEHTYDAAGKCTNCGESRPSSATSEPTVTIQSVGAEAGKSVKVCAYVSNNPGVAGARFKLTFAQGLTLKSAEAGEGFEPLDYTPPASLENGCLFNWDSLFQVSEADGLLLTFEFILPDSARSGDTFEVKLTYTKGDIYDYNLQDIDFAVESGKITVN